MGIATSASGKAIPIKSAIGGLCLGKNKENAWYEKTYAPAAMSSATNAK
jgi:hypothetical protein